MKIVHNLDPFALQLSEGVGVRWYGLSYLVAFLLGYLIIKWMSARRLTLIQGDKIGDFIFSVAIGAIIGGRLGYCLFYSPDLFFTITASFPFWGVLAFHQGGMASHGGMIGIGFACWLFARKHSLPWFHLCDLTVLGATLGIFFGRIANFINGELLGREAPSNFPVIVKFPQEILEWPHSSPEKLQQLSEIVPLVGVSSDSWAAMLLSPNTSQNLAKIVETLERIIFSIQNGSGYVSQALAPHLVGRYPSQLIAAVLEGLLIFFVVLWFWRKARKPGVVSGLFFSLYAIVRTFNEQFRLPDAHVGYQLFELTRGQWLSIALFFFGTIWIWRAFTHESEAIGGWLSGNSKSKI